MDIKKDDSDTISKSSFKCGIASFFSTLLYRVHFPFYMSYGSQRGGKEQERAL